MKRSINTAGFALGDGLLWPISLALLTTLASTATAFALLLGPAAIGG